MICMGDVWTINYKPENLKTNLPSLRENHIGSIMGAEKMMFEDDMGIRLMTGWWFGT